MYGGTRLRKPFGVGATMGVTLNTNKWYEKSGSPVINKNGEFYLDASKFNFLEAFKKYPDISNHYVTISYAFEFNGCSGNMVQGDIKEVVVKPLNSDKELFRVTL